MIDADRLDWLPLMSRMLALHSSLCRLGFDPASEIFVELGWCFGCKGAHAFVVPTRDGCGMGFDCGSLFTVCAQEALLRESLKPPREFREAFAKAWDETVVWWNTAAQETRETLWARHRPDNGLLVKSLVRVWPSVTFPVAN